MIYLEFVLTFKIDRQLTLIGFTLYCNSYVKVNRNKVIIIIMREDWPRCTPTQYFNVSGERKQLPS